MSRRSVVLCATGIALLALAYFAAITDWYAFGDAVPPTVPAPLLNKKVEALDWTIDGATENADVGVTAGEPFRLVGQFPLDVDRWWWGTLTGFSKPLDRTSHVAKPADPAPLLRAEVISRPSLGPGEFVAARRYLKLRRVGKTAARFDSDLKAPLRPGVYELRLTFGSLGVTQTPHMQRLKWNDEQVIASRLFRVQHGANAAP